MNKLIKRFIRDECANFDKHSEACLDDKPCKVLSGQRCGYFEKAVLGPPDYKYRLPGYDYAKLFAEYAELAGAESRAVQVRRCGCGEPLRNRQRYCGDCSRKRRKESNRANQKKYRTLSRTTVSS